MVHGLSNRRAAHANGIRLRRLREARIARDVYADYAAYRRIRMQAIDEFLNAFPDVRKMRHEITHGPGGIYEGRRCPQCSKTKGPGAAAPRPVVGREAPTLKPELTT